MDRRLTLGAALFACLLAATLIAAVLVVRARTPDLVLEVTEPARDESPTIAVGGPGADEVEITFFVRESDAEALVGIVDRREDLIRTLDASAALTENEPATYLWDGLTDAGTPAPPGRYRLLVELPSEDREMIWPRRINVAPSGTPTDE